VRLDVSPTDRRGVRLLPSPLTRDLAPASHPSDQDDTWTDLGPAELLLAVTRRRSPARLLAIGRMLGTAWTGPWPDRLRGESDGEVIALVETGLQGRPQDLIDLNTAAAVLLLSPDVSVLEPQAEQAQRNLKRLLGDVRVEPQVHLGATGAPGRWSVTATAVFVSDNPFSLAAAELLERAKGGQQLRVCAYCECLFFPSERSDQAYCRRVAPGEPVGGRACYQVGPRARYKQDLDQYETVRRRAYKRLDQRVRRGAIARDEVDAWRTTSHNTVQLARQKGWTVEQLERELARTEPR
jgi:hypothetical protein